MSSCDHYPILSKWIVIDEYTESHRKYVVYQCPECKEKYISKRYSAGASMGSNNVHAIYNVNGAPVPVNEKGNVLSTPNTKNIKKRSWKRNPEL